MRRRCVAPICFLSSTQGTGLLQAPNYCIARSSCAIVEASWCVICNSPPRPASRRPHSSSYDVFGQAGRCTYPWTLRSCVPPLLPAAPHVAKASVRQLAVCAPSWSAPAPKLPLVCWATTSTSQHAVRPPRNSRGFAGRRRLFPREEKEPPLEAQTVVPSLSRQRGLLLEKLPVTICSAELLARQLRRNGLFISPDDVFVQRTRLGQPTGRALVLSVAPVEAPELLRNFGPESSVKVCDTHDVSLALEQFERFVRLTEDLQFLGRPEHFRRVVTITEIPDSYGRYEVAEMLRDATGIDVPPPHIVFRIRNDGTQTDMAWVLCPSEEAANSILNIIQEYTVPKSARYGALFGAAFLTAARSSLFLCDPELDFLASRSRTQVALLGFHPDVGEKEFNAFLNGLKFFPSHIRKIHMPADDSAMFFVELDRMRNCKIQMESK
eukprot:GHVT01029919.1.p1 GENE.GHVT01029919.1~~GHVT01029919.1.p1  ORF type:complete len:438 (+),score=47.09 GHVT01029919.1:289-1602(+)